MNKKEIGMFGEKNAVEYLVKNKYKILATNYRCNRFGEIDIIAKDKNTICFIEVKTRTSILFGLPSESVTYRKQSKIINLAKLFIAFNKLESHTLRFDVIELILEKRTKIIKSINHIKDAFY